MCEHKNILSFLLTGTAVVAPPLPLCSPTKNPVPSTFTKKIYEYRRLKNTIDKKTSWSDEIVIKPNI